MPRVRSLRELERLRAEYGGEHAARKLFLLRELERARLTSAKAVLRLHEVLCFLRAYADDAADQSSDAADLASVPPSVVTASSGLRGRSCQPNFEPVTGSLSVRNGPTGRPDSPSRFTPGACAHA